MGTVSPKIWMRRSFTVLLVSSRVCLVLLVCLILGADPLSPKSLIAWTLRLLLAVFLLYIVQIVHRNQGGSIHDGVPSLII